MLLLKAVKTISVKAEDIDGYRGCDDLDSILEFIESKPKEGASSHSAAASTGGGGTMKRAKQKKGPANPAQSAVAATPAQRKRSRTPSRSKKTRSISSRSSSVGQKGPAPADTSSKAAAKDSSSSSTKGRLYFCAHNIFFCQKSKNLPFL